MSKKATMQDIAEILGVSRVTVSKAFKGSNDISPETKSKVFKVAKELNYTYKTVSQLNVMVIMTPLFLEMDELFYTKIYKKLIQDAKQNNLSINLTVITKDMIKKNELPELSDDIDGLIILGEFKDNYLKLIETLNLPIVFVDFHNNNFNYDSIITNNYLYSYEITSHLINNGHKKIGFVGNINSTNSVTDRYLGYNKALLEHNYTLDEKLIISDRDENGLLKTFDLPKELPTAFVCNNDFTAINLINYLEKNGYKVPNDISVVGFDDVINLDIQSHQLTTVKVNIDEMVHLAIRRMVYNITKKDTTHKTYVVNSKIIYRNTVKTL